MTTANDKELLAVPWPASVKRSRFLSDKLTLKQDSFARQVAVGVAYRNAKKPNATPKRGILRGMKIQHFYVTY